MAKMLSSPTLVKVEDRSHDSLDEHGDTTLDDPELPDMNVAPPAYESIHADPRILSAPVPSSSSPVLSESGTGIRPPLASNSEKSTSIPGGFSQPFPTRGARNTPSDPSILSEPSRSFTRRKPVPNPAKSSVLPLTVPTKKYVLSSGFPYHSSIFDIGISPDTWTRFSDDIVQATKLSVTQQSLAWTSGIGVGLVSVTAAPPFGAAAGVFAGKAVYDRSILKNVTQGLEQGKLGQVLKKWNEDCWREKGITVKLVVKQNSNQTNQDEDRPGKKDKKQEKNKDRQKGRFQLVLESFDAVTGSTNASGVDTNTLSIIEIEDTPIAATPVEIGQSAPPELPRRSPNRPSPTPELADEKAAAADLARLSMDSAHPSDRQQPPNVNHTADNVDESPTSDSRRWPGGVRDRPSQDPHVSSGSISVRRGSQDLTMDEHLAPAPLFSS